MFELLRQLVSSDPTGLLGSGVQSIQSHFGTPGLIAAIILGLSIVVLIVNKLLKLAFDIFRYVIVPSSVVTFIIICFLPYPIVNVLPVTVALFSVVLIVKG